MDVGPTAPVLVERRGAVALITLNRPDRLNALTVAMESQYFDVLRQSDGDPAVRAIVVTGAGRGFCAGMDMAADDEAADPTRATAPASARRAAMTVRKPVIAAINGAAAGLGLALALHCDLRFATPVAKLTTSFARRGLVAEAGLAWLLPRLVGASGALDLLLSARVVLGEEALRLGLIDRVVEPDALVQEVVAYADDLARNCSPWALATIKRQVYDGLDSTADGAYRSCDELMRIAADRPDAAEGIASFVERRPPRFPALGPEA